MNFQYHCYILKLLETIYDVLWTFLHIKTDKIMFGNPKAIKNIDCDSVTEGQSTVNEDVLLKSAINSKSTLQYKMRSNLSYTINQNIN